MFEITLANWPPVSRLLAENVSEWFMLFGVLHKLAIGFAVVSVAPPLKGHEGEPTPVEHPW